MASVLSLLMVDIVGLLAALSIWAASFLPMVPSQRSVLTQHFNTRIAT